MESFKEFEKLNKGLSMKERKEIYKIVGKEDVKKHPYKNTCHKTVGEYFPTIEDKIKLLHYLKDHPTMPGEDKRYIKECLKFVDEYENKGLFWGTLNGLAALFFPGVRRLAFYKRVPIAFAFCYIWMKIGYNYGRDVLLVKTRNVIENWERDMGIRHFQLGI